ncbi:MAG: outer membrane beta-barrel protein [Campylobacterota bacterium]|nr:outer membrane beta-barrel protein [Campylobacterota bacterium]
MKKLILLASCILMMDASQRVYVNIASEVGGLNFSSENQEAVNTSMSSVLIDTGIINNNLMIGCRARVINNSCVECDEKNIGSGYSIDAKIGISDRKQSFSLYGLLSYLSYDFGNTNETIDNDVGVGVGLGGSIKLNEQPFNSVPNALMLNYIYYSMDGDESKENYNMSNLSIGLSWSF